MKNKKSLFMTSVFAVVLLALVIAVVQNHQNSNNDQTITAKIKIKDFSRPEGTICTALMPVCGYCPGEVIDKTCYVTQVQFDEYKKLYSGLEADK